MKRDLWLGLGIAGVACLLMCGAQSGGTADDAASEETAAPAASQPAASQVPRQPGTGGSGTDTQVPSGAAPSQSPAPQSANPGQSPIANPNSPNPEGRTTPPNPDANAGTGGTGNTGTAAPATPPAPGAQQSVAVVDAIYRGTVESVSPNEVVIDNAGTRLPLEINNQTRIVREGEKISATQLKEGERVRATVNLVGRSHTREIAVLTGAEARRDVANQQRR